MSRVRLLWNSLKNPKNIVLCKFYIIMNLFGFALQFFVRVFSILNSFELRAYVGASTDFSFCKGALIKMVYVILEA